MKYIVFQIFVRLFKGGGLAEASPLSSISELSVWLPTLTADAAFGAIFDSNASSELLNISIFAQLCINMCQQCNLHTHIYTNVILFKFNLLPSSPPENKV